MVTASWFSRFGHSLAVFPSEVLCRRLTSYCASNPIASASVPRGTHHKTSRGKTLLFHRAMPELLLCASGRGSGYLSIARLPSHNSLTIRFLFVIAMLCHPLPSDSTSRWTPLLRLAVPPQRGPQRTCTSWINAMPGAQKIFAGYAGKPRLPAGLRVKGARLKIQGFRSWTSRKPPLRWRPDGVTQPRNAARRPRGL